MGWVLDGNWDRATSGVGLHGKYFAEAMSQICIGVNQRIQILNAAQESGGVSGVGSGYSEVAFKTTDDISESGPSSTAPSATDFTHALNGRCWRKFLEDAKAAIDAIAPVFVKEQKENQSLTEYWTAETLEDEAGGGLRPFDIDRSVFYADNWLILKRSLDLLTQLQCTVTIKNASREVTLKRESLGFCLEQLGILAPPRNAPASAMLPFLKTSTQTGLEAYGAAAIWGVGGFGNVSLYEGGKTFGAWDLSGFPGSAVILKSKAAADYTGAWTEGASVFFNSRFTSDGTPIADLTPSTIISAGGASGSTSSTASIEFVGLSLDANPLGKEIGYSTAFSGSIALNDTVIGFHTGEIGSRITYGVTGSFLTLLISLAPALDDQI